MTKVEFVNKITRTFHRAGFKLKQHSPEILIVGGVIGVAASTVMACKATLKAPAIIEDAKNTINAVHELLEDEEKAKKYTEDDAKKALFHVYGSTGLKLVKLYAPSVALGVASVSCIVASHGIMHKRNVALAAAYATVDKSFKEYKNRVIERFGEELNDELRNDIRMEEVEEKITDENGEEKTIKKTIKVGEISEYDKFFDEYCDGWTKDAEANLTFLLLQQNYANEKLQSRGHLFLNEVYDMLGIPRTKAGNTIGWKYDLKNKDLHNYVDFGIIDLYDAQKRDFVNGRERSILLHFNPDGNILNDLA